MAKEQIICAAIYFDDGEKHEHQPFNISTGFVICGMRHNNCYATLSIFKGHRGRFEYKRAVQGFITTHTRFVNRTEATIIAVEAKQIINLDENPKWKTTDLSDIELYSDDIY